jgi:hypothetical protein
VLPQRHPMHRGLSQLSQLLAVPLHNGAGGLKEPGQHVQGTKRKQGPCQEKGRILMLQGSRPVCRRRVALQHGKRSSALQLDLLLLLPLLPLLPLMPQKSKARSQPCLKSRLAQGHRTWSRVTEQRTGVPGRVLLGARASSQKHCTRPRATNLPVPMDRRHSLRCRAVRTEARILRGV